MRFYLFAILFILRWWYGNDQVLHLSWFSYPSIFKDDGLSMRDSTKKKENWNMVSAAILQKRKIMQLPGIKCLHSLPTLAWNKTFLPLPLKQNFSLKMVLYKPGLQIQWTPGDFEKDFWVLGIFAYLCIYFWRFFNTVFPFEFWRTLNCLENFP